MKITHVYGKKDCPNCERVLLMVGEHEYFDMSKTSTYWHERVRDMNLLSVQAEYCITNELPIVQVVDTDTGAVVTLGYREFLKVHEFNLKEDDRCTGVVCKL